MVIEQKTGQYWWSFAKSNTKKYALLDQLPAILTSDDFIRSNQIIRTKWPIY